MLIVDLAKIRLTLDDLGTNLEEELMLNCALRAFTAFASQGSGAGKPGRDAALAASLTLLGRGNSSELIIVISNYDDLQFLQRIVRLSSATVFVSSLLSSARLATRIADERRSGHCAFFQAQPRQRGLVNMQAALPGVMARGTLHLHYQPKIDLTSGKIVGVKAARTSATGCREFSYIGLGIQNGMGVSKFKGCDGQSCKSGGIICMRRCRAGITPGLTLKAGCSGTVQQEAPVSVLRKDPRTRA